MAVPEGWRRCVYYRDGTRAYVEPRNSWQPTRLLDISSADSDGVFYISLPAPLQPPDTMTEIQIWDFIPLNLRR